jgi:GntR family transcriptional repressor for pyruvate dehydrogenase complex
VAVRPDSATHRHRRLSLAVFHSKFGSTGYAAELRLAGAPVDNSGVPVSTRPVPVFDAPRHEPVSADVTRKLLEWLLSGGVEPGERIASERQLTEALGVGRSAVREAIKTLNALGLLDVRQGSGTYLAASSSGLLPKVIEWGLLLGERSARDLMESRRLLEVDIAGLAAERRDDEAMAALRTAFGKMQTAGGDIPAYVEADVEFHLALANASGNQVLADVLRSIRSLLDVWARRVLEAAGETASSLKMHEPILKAVAKGDPDAARSAMRRHMERAERRLREALARDNVAFP